MKIKAFFRETDQDPPPSAEAGLAEKRFGKARDTSEFIYVLLGAGTGAAFFLGGKLYTGKGGLAGEFSHATIDEQGPLCS